MNEQTKQFINKYLNDDVHTLALQAKRYPEVDMALAVRQITGRQKMKRKVPLFYESDDMLYLFRLSLEQASSELTARYKAGLCEGKTFIDLTGGLGVDCFFISRNFEQAFYVEKQAELCEIARHNFTALNAENISLVNALAEEYLNTTEAVDCIFIDPARRSGDGKKLIFLSDCEPDVGKLASALLTKSDRTLIKLSPMIDISSTIKQLPRIIHEVHIVAIDNECKEVLLLLKKEEAGDIKILTINFNGKTEKQTFEYMAGEEAGARVRHSSDLGKYLYEPNAAIMKSGAFKLISNYFEIRKLHVNTHLYTSDEYIANFPGRTFEITANWGNSKHAWKTHVAQTRRANLAVRNYPLSADELKKKLKLLDGGELYLFACTLAGGEKAILACKKTEKNQN